MSASAMLPLGDRKDPATQLPQQRDPLARREMSVRLLLVRERPGVLDSSASQSRAKTFGSDAHGLILRHLVPDVSTPSPTASADLCQLSTLFTRQPCTKATRLAPCARCPRPLSTRSSEPSRRSTPTRTRSRANPAPLTAIHSPPRPARLSCQPRSSAEISPGARPADKRRPSTRTPFKQPGR